MDKKLHCLTLNLLTTTIVAPPSNASKWQMGFNSAFEGLICHKEEEEEYEEVGGGAGKREEGGGRRRGGRRGGRRAGGARICKYISNWRNRCCKHEPPDTEYISKCEMLLTDGSIFLRRLTASNEDMSGK